MAKKITEQTKLKVGDLVAYGTTEGLAVYQVAKVERKKGMSPCICLNKSPDHKEFLKENGVDLWTRIHQIDLVRNGAELIPVIELVMHHDHSGTIIRDLRYKLQQHEEKIIRQY